MDLDLDLAALSMTEIIRLQNLLSQELSRRFETEAAICFSDIVGSTAYFARFGDVAGRQLQQMHFDLLERVLAQHQGRLVDTAGDGAVSFFAAGSAAATAMGELARAVSAENAHRAREHQLLLRIGMHWGRLLSDGVQVTGDVMNLCARIAASAEPGQIRLSRECFRELDFDARLRCRRLGDVELKGAGRAVELLALDWLGRERYPVEVLVRETGERIALPEQDIVAFGRLDLVEGMPANDVVLALPDRTATRQISRWHFELRRAREGCVLRALSSHSTYVDGRSLQRGDELPVGPGSVVVLSGVMTLELLGGSDLADARGEPTMVV
jgi:class 3 adenylate cyclase